MGEHDTTLIETPLPRRAASRRCSDHSALVVHINGLKEALVEERQARERAFSVLATKLDAASAEVGKLKVDMAKLLGGIAAVLAIVQIVLKFIPGGG